MAGTGVLASPPGAHFGNWGGLGIWSGGLDCHGIAWVRLSKIDDYLADNVSCNRLSDLGDRVNDKAAVRSWGLWKQSGGARRPRL